MGLRPPPDSSIISSSDSDITKVILTRGSYDVPPPFCSAARLPLRALATVAILLLRWQYSAASYPS
jgi:hypothetical protein